MPPKPLFDLDLVDLSATVFARQHIRQRIAQRAEMEMIDRIVLFEPERGRIAGVKEVRKEEFWVAGHFPGRPLFPGVLMIEAAGQLCSFYFAQVGGADTVIAFAAADNVRFRGVVTPGDTLVI
ncbi:MAG: 3-hydroxyacyl-ACP dehydratase FabZ family protein, partial [Planctomycetota bacterium]